MNKNKNKNSTAASSTDKRSSRQPHRASRIERFECAEEVDQVDVCEVETWTISVQCHGQILHNMYNTETKSESLWPFCIDHLRICRVERTTSEERATGDVGLRYLRP